MAGQEIPRDAGQPAGVADRRSMLDGDVAPVQTPAAIAAFVARGATEAARTKQEGALADMLARDGPRAGPRNCLTRFGPSAPAGASPDDAKALREALLDRTPQPESAMPPDDQLADDWREGGYPYRNLMQRKESYERQKCSLQVELLKMQAWMKDAGQKTRHPVRGP